MPAHTSPVLAADPATSPARIRLSPPPPALMRMVNPLVRRFLMSPVLGRRMGSKALLEFDGRRSGRRYRIPVCLHHIAGAAVVFTCRPWRLNLSCGTPVLVTHAGRPQRGRAELVDASGADIGIALRTALDNGASPFELGLKVERGYSPTAADLSGIGQSLIRIDFDLPRD